MTREVLLAATRDGAVRASLAPDGGWTVERTFSDDRVHCLAADPSHPHVVYAGTEKRGPMRSADAGLTWRPCGLLPRPVRSVAVSPHDPNVVYAGVRPAAIFRSTDAGSTWHELESLQRVRGRRLWFSPAGAPFTAYVHAIAVSPTDPDVVVVGIEFGAVVRSADGGETWSTHRPGALRDCHSLCFHAHDGAHVYEGGFGGAALSSDGGVTWESPRDGLDRKYGWAVAADPGRPEVCYVAVAPGPGKAHGPKPAEAFVFRRIGAEPWRKLAGGLPQPLDAMPYSLVTHPNEPGTITAALANGDVWRSTDLGETWAQLPVGLPPLDALIVPQR